MLIVEEIIHFCLRCIGRILADQECCICEKRKTAKCGSGYEALEKCETENGARTLQQAAELNEYPLLQAKVLGSDWQTILAMEFFYHRSCYRGICKKRTANAVPSNDAEKVFQKLTEVIEEKVILGCEVLRLVDMSTLCSEIKIRLFGGESEITLPPPID